MEGITSDREFDDIEKLLFEIPGGSRKLYNSSLYSGSRIEEDISVSNLPDEKTLALAFEELVSVSEPDPEFRTYQCLPNVVVPRNDLATYPCQHPFYEQSLYQCPVQNVIFGNQRQPFFEIPYLNDYTLRNPYSELEWQVFDQVRKHYFPEKILTRSHGVNSLRSLKNGRSYVLDASDAKPLDLKFNSVDEVKGSIYHLAKDQLGCRFLQRKFSESCAEDIAKIFAEIIGHIVELMTDPFGNYLVQKLLEVCNEEQRMQILNVITEESGILFGISCNMHGTRAVQKVIETVKSTEQISKVVSALKPGIVSLMKDINGNHVAQRCLQYFSSTFNEFIYDAAIAHCSELATDRQGCCVLQKCVHHSTGDRKNMLLTEICSNSLLFSQNAYGNYVVQFVLEQKISRATSALICQLQGNYEELSKQKHGSNVVEKCLKHANEDERVQIVQQLISSPHFLHIVLDRYGNYVIQSALKQCKGVLLSMLVDAIKPHIPILRTNPYGKKVLSNNVLRKFV